MKYGDFKHTAPVCRAVDPPPFNCAQRLPVAPSPRFLRGLAALHAGVGVALLSELGHQPLAWVLAIALVLHVPLICAQWRTEARHFRAARLTPEGAWWLETMAGDLLPARLGNTRFVTSSWLLLPVQLERGRGGVTLCLMRDNLTPDEFRRLRVRLLWG